MMSSQLLFLTTIATVPWIYAVEKCIDCNLLPTKEARDTSGPATCSLNCFLRAQSKPDIFTPWSKVSPMLQFDDAGIYYEPADVIPVDQVRFIQQPFYIINPAYQVDGRISRSAVKPDNDKKITLPINKHGLKSRHKKPENHRRKDDNGHKKTEKNIQKFPFYLDVDIQEPRTETRGTPDVDSHLGNLKLAEKFLAICLDLHLLEFYRKNDSTFMNLKDVWDVPKFHFYESLSDLDLQNEIKKNCNHSIHTVTKSLDEIKDTWPKNNVDSFSSSQDFLINARSGDISNHTVQIHTGGLISNASSAKTIFNPVNFTFTEQTTSATNIVDSTDPKNIVITETMIHDPVFRTISSYNNAGNEFQFTSNSTVEQIKIDVPTPSSVGNDAITETTYVTSGTQDPKVRDRSSLPNFYVEDSLQFNSSNEPVHKPIEGESTPSIYNNSKIYFISLIRRTLNAEPKDVPMVHDPITPSTTEPITTFETEIISTKGNNEEYFTTTPYAEYRNTYSDDNIEGSEKVTKEYPNDSAVSSVGGLNYPVLNNNSTLFVEKDMSAISILSDTSTENTTDKNKITNNENIPQSVESTLGEPFTGSLYFLYENNSIPARFIQHPDGKINVGIDGYSLCDSVNASTVKSVLIIVLCNCVKFSNCTKSS